MQVVQVLAAGGTIQMDGAPQAGAPACASADTEHQRQALELLHLSQAEREHGGQLDGVLLAGAAACTSASADAERTGIWIATTLVTYTNGRVWLYWLRVNDVGCQESPQPAHVVIRPASQHHYPHFPS